MRFLIHLLAPVLLLFSGTLSAQLADQPAHDKSAETLKTLYNEKDFAGIYNQLSPGFKNTTAQTDFTAFLEGNIYRPLGHMQQLSFAAKEEEGFSYLAYFKNGALRLTLAVNPAGQIEGLQFVPYEPPAKTRVYSYAGDNKKQDALDLLVDSIVKIYMQNPLNCGLSIGISQNGRQRFYNYGEIKRDSKELPQATTIYEIGSMTKTFCGILLAQAILDKKIKPNDDIRRYLGSGYYNLEWNKKPILVKHLANHTSGLPRIPENLFTTAGFDLLNPYKHYSRQQVFAYLKTIKPAQEPGTVCDYSNLGMALLGLILEDLYGQPFEMLVKEKICMPNGMSSTAIQLTDAELNRFAQGYNQEGNATPHWELGDFAAAGGLRSTAADMLRYLDYNLAEKDEATRLAHTPTFSDRQTLGLAWFIKKTKQGNTLLWHNGGTYGFSCFGGCLKEKNSSVMILSNSTGNADFIGIAILNFLQP